MNINSNLPKLFIDPFRYTVKYPNGAIVYYDLSSIKNNQIDCGRYPYRIKYDNDDSVWFENGKVVCIETYYGKNFTFRLK